MKKMITSSLVLMLVLAACSSYGIPSNLPGEPASVTQDPAVDTAIAELAGTQIAATKTTAGESLSLQPTSPADSTAIPQEVLTPTTAPTETMLPTVLATVQTATNPALETIASTPTIVKTDSKLPAPLYYLSYSNEYKQIWRMETDGQSTRPVTTEALDVSEFDVSPSDGRLAYVVNNDLFIANGDGTNRTLLVDGVEPLPENDPNRTTLDIGKVRWSPTGTLIAYGLGGVNIVSAGGGAPAQLLKSDLVPQPPDYNSDGPVYFYWPESWSPDGSRLLVSYAIWPEQGGLMVIPAAGGEPVVIEPVESYPCCNPVWTLDGKGILYASQFFGMIHAGMWQSDATTGSSHVLIQGDPQNGSYHLPGFVHPATDGKIYFFYGTTEEFPEGGISLAPVFADMEPIGQPVSLRGDTWQVAEALWTPDGQGVVILDQLSATNGEYPLMGKLIYLQSGDSPPLTLPATGGMLRWGR